MSNEQLIKLMSGRVICYDEGGFACSLPAEDRKKIAEALKKQAPKKPVKGFVEQEIYNGGGFKELVERNLCPKCRKTVWSQQPHCIRCGQAIDWSEVEE